MIKSTFRFSFLILALLSSQLLGCVAIDSDVGSAPSLKDSVSFDSKEAVGKPGSAIDSGSIDESDLSGAELLTPVHKPGVCAIYSSCGKQSLFGSELPCPANFPAKDPDHETREALVEVCGEENWATGPICCDIGQIKALKENLKKAANLIESCPACKENFFQFFCRFTCSPNQSQFVNITKVGKSRSGLAVVEQLDHYADPDFAAGFYESCKEVKFGAGNAMDFLGGGAKNYTQFLKYLGDKKPLVGGSPFQMDFPWDDTPKEIKRSDGVVRRCNDTDERFRCECDDCSGSCDAEDSKNQEPNLFGLFGLVGMFFYLLVGDETSTDEERCCLKAIGVIGLVGMVVYFVTKWFSMRNRSSSPDDEAHEETEFRDEKFTRYHV